MDTVHLGEPHPICALPHWQRSSQTEELHRAAPLYPGGPDARPSRDPATSAGSRGAIGATASSQQPTQLPAPIDATLSELSSRPTSVRLNVGDAGSDGSEAYSIELPDCRGIC